ncbi:MAG: hypothetical protein HY909_26630 [Deltaproteobacteria bacterium]|nr:hypothetical protein [Deltaproteobacteria bacterium]
MAENKAQGAAPAPGTRLQVRNLVLLGLVLVGLWALAVASRSTPALVVLGVLTAALAGIGVYLWRYIQKQQDLQKLLLASAAGPEARREAIAKLTALDANGKDAMATFARAQLEVQEDLDKAVATIEGIDPAKLPPPQLNELRMFKAQLFVLKNRFEEAADQASRVDISKAQQEELKPVMAATVAEAWAHVGKTSEALALLQTYAPEKAPEGARVPLLIARVFAHYHANKRELVRKDMLTLLKMKLEYLGRFAAPQFNVPGELKAMAEDLVRNSPEAREKLLSGEAGVKLNREQRRKLERKK